MISIYLKRAYLLHHHRFSFHEDEYCIESFNFKYQTVRVALYDRKQSLQYSQERLHCDYVTNILQKEMILGIPDQVILYNFLSMLPQSYRHYPTYLIRAVVTSIIHREVLLYLIMYQFIYSVINGFNVLK